MEPQTRSGKSSTKRCLAVILSKIQGTSDHRSLHKEIDWRENAPSFN